MPTVRPRLLTFDIFGTVLDWRTGLEQACRTAGRPLEPDEFDRVVDAQGMLERGPFLDYATVTRRSLVEEIGLGERAAAEIGEAVGRWPLFPDASVLRALMGLVPCAAMTNSDRRHGEDVQAGLGFRLAAWLCAEEVGLYKPDPGFWSAMARLQDVTPGPAWWHVSAYADYDLGAAAALGLTTVFVRRPHARPGPADHVVAGLAGLLALVQAGAPP